MSDDSDQTLPRVLIIDDSRMVRASIIRQVRDRFDVREEADGEAGWQTLLVDPTIQAVILLFSFVYVMINLAVDMMYTVLDPRIRY